MPCPSGKIRYRNKLDARIALAFLRRRRDRGDHREAGGYWCPHCHGWHLTSQRRKP